MAPLEELTRKIAVANERLAGILVGDAREMKEIADGLERTFGQGREPDREIILKTLQKLDQTGLLESYKEIKTACYGLLVPLGAKTSIADDRDKLEFVLSLVDHYERDPKKLKRCFQAVMGAYFAFEGFETGSPSHAQWLSMRGRLSKWLPQLEEFTPRPDWLDAALNHSTLFGPDPTEDLGYRVLKGDTAAFENVSAQLSISSESWVRRQVVVSAVKAATLEGEATFHSKLDQMLALLAANPAVQNQGIAMLLNRYAQLSSTAEHAPLRTVAVAGFGNPLIVANRPRWFEVSADAQEMVASWIKGFLIERFFELLSHDGRTDKRRPKFWASYRNSIENMWFVLGPTATSNWNEDFKKLRGSMGNQCLSLDGASPGNNAFVMKLGKIYVVEFGEKGNATFLFKESSSAFDLTKRRVELRELKDSSYEDRLLHMDGNVRWEKKFAHSLAAYGIHPDDDRWTTGRGRRTATSTAAIQVTRDSFLREFKKFCNERGIRYDDRAPSGRIVVYTQMGNSSIARELTHWGFQYNSDERRWIKNP